MQAMTHVSTDCILGSILAGALGDAFGAPYEGRPAPFTCEPTPPLRITDDTQLTLATCEGISTSGEATPESIAESLRVWFKQRKLSRLGSATLGALQGLLAGGHWALVGTKGDKAAGNGAAIRIAPVAFVLSPDLRPNRTLIRDICFITHQSDEAYAGALAQLGGIRSAADPTRTESKEVYSSLIEILPDSHVRDRLDEINTDQLEPDQLASRHSPSGFVADSVPLAIACSLAWGSLPLESYLRRVVELGGDSDSIGSMAGQLWGARHGFRSIPEKLQAMLADLAEIRRVTEAFSRSISAS